MSIIDKKVHSQRLPSRYTAQGNCAERENRSPRKRYRKQTPHIAKQGAYKLDMKKCLVLFLVLVFATLSVSSFAACSFANDYQYKESDYAIDLTLDPSTQTITGNTSITYYSRAKNTSSLSLQLHANAYRLAVVGERMLEYCYPKNKLSYGGITIDKITSSTHDIASYEIVGETLTVLRVKLSKPLKRKEKIVFDISYSINLANLKHRLGYYDYVYNIANFYPVMCVFEDGAFKEYDYTLIGDPFYTETADYKVNFTCPANFVVAHTGNSSESVLNDDNTKTLAISAENVRDFAICASPYFILRTAQVGNATVKYYYTQESDAAARLEHISSVLSALGGYFGSYPYDTFCVVKTPFAFGGMEYPGLVYVSDSLEKEELDMTIVHETAHQWWYGTVGNDQIRYAWLDEALAEFSTFYYYRQTDSKKYKLYFQENYDQYVRYASITGLTGDIAAMDAPLYEYDDYRYSANIYLKGMLMLMSLYEIKGEALIGALNSYAETYRYKTATPELFIATLSKVMKSPLQNYFDAWLKGKVILL